jgi:hypothetical protein
MVVDGASIAAIVGVLVGGFSQSVTDRCLDCFVRVGSATERRAKKEGG